MICDVCGKTINGQYLNIRDQGGTGKILYNICLDCNQKFCEITKGEVPYSMNPEEMRQIIGITEGKIADNQKEREITSEECEKEQKNSFKVGLAVLLFAFVVIILFSSIQSENSSSNSRSSSYSPSSQAYTMDHTTYCILYMDISDVSVTHDGNYAYCTGKITNTGTYQIKYVKVKASCKDKNGTVIDTDWTYAVDSSWLNPGESKSFEMMIKDEGKKIKSCDVTIIYD